MILRAIFQFFFFYGLLIGLVIFTCIYLYFKFSYTYWARKGVPYLKPTFPLGNNDCVSGDHLSYGMETLEWYNEFKQRGVKIGGAYSWAKPVITVTDPDYVRDVLVKDFSIFINREFYSNPKHDPENESLFVVKGEEWKLTRQKLSPFYTTSKLRMLMDGLVKNTEVFGEKLEDIAENDKAVNIRELINDWTMDNIGKLFFGLDFNCLTDDTSQYRIFGRQTLRVEWRRKPVVVFSRFAEKIAQFAGIKNFPPNTTSMFSNAVRKNAEYRKKNNITRQDYLQLLMNYQQSDEGQKNLFDFNKVVANHILAFNAGFETTSGAVSFALYELSQHLDIQEKTRQEVKTVLKKYDGKINYDALMEMTYLKQVLDESLRMYPPLPSISRINTKPYTFANTNITIPTDTTVVISVVGFGRDSEYYPNPNKFDPEHFNVENRSKRNPYVFLPFGEGPRNCVGARFGVIQALSAIALILSKFKLTSEPRKSSPVVLRSGTFTACAVEPLMLKLQKI